MQNKNLNILTDFQFSDLQNVLHFIYNGEVNLEQVLSRW
jgi:hypothetical protein